MSWLLTIKALFPQEYLEMQRQLAIQRLQEQEKERQMRLEQQKQTIQMRAQMPAFSLPYAQVRLLGQRPSCQVPGDMA